MKLKFIISGIACLLVQSLFGQHQLQSYLEFNDALYTFDGKAYSLKQVQRHFPAYDVFEKDLTQGYRLKLKKGKNNQRYTQLALNSDTISIDDQTACYWRSYTENVEALSMSLFDFGQNQWKTLKINLQTDGLQSPEFFPLSQWQPAAEGFDPKNKQALHIYCQPKDPKKKVVLEIGSLMISKYYMEGVAVVNDFFSGIVDDLSDSLASLPQREVMLDEFLLPMNINYLSTPSNLVLSSKEHSVKEPALVYQVLNRTFDRYLFYKETGIDKAKVKSGFESQFRQRMLNADSMSCDLIDDLAYFVENEFKDPHFGIKRGGCVRPEEGRLSRGPIRLYEFGEKVKVAAVLSPAYEQSIEIGAQLESVNGQEIGGLIDSLSQSLGPWERRSDIVSNLLKRTRNDSVLLGIKGLPEPVMVKYDVPIKIPENFRYKHCEFKDIDDDIAYFRVKTWTLDVYFEFNRYWRQIRNKKNLILDLRSNTGGEFLSALRLMTIFLGQPMEHFRMMQSNQRYESFVAKPNPNLHFPSSSKVIILVDAKTACTSESFILGMKKLPNVTLIGQDKTYGTDGSRNDITFPSGFSIYVNAIAKKNIYPNDFILETEGINPDIWVYPQEVRDLRPYNDKVLQSALELIKNKNF